MCAPNKNQSGAAFDTITVGNGFFSSVKQNDAAGNED